MEWIFKDKAKKEGASVTDLVLLILQLLREDIQKVVDSIELVKLQDKGQLSHVDRLVYKNIGMWERDNILIY